MLNKADLLTADALAQRQQQITDSLAWQGPVYTISALAKTGTEQIVYDIMNYLTYDHEERAQNNDTAPDDNIDDGQD